MVRVTVAVRGVVRVVVVRVAGLGPPGFSEFPKYNPPLQYNNERTITLPALHFPPI